MCGSGRRLRGVTGKFTYGNFSSKDCPVGSFAITTTISCQVAATAAAVPYTSMPLADPTYPCGCIWMKNQIQVNLNTAPNCAASFNARPVCALDQTLCCSTGLQPTPAPTPLADQYYNCAAHLRIGVVPNSLLLRHVQARRRPARRAQGWLVRTLAWPPSARACA